MPDQLSSGELDSLGFAHPNPLLRRPKWRSLNGLWRFAADPGAKWERPSEVRYEAEILVPYAPETSMSGQRRLEPINRAWWERMIEVPEPDGSGQHTVLHFEAVDYITTIYIDGNEVHWHEGGYTPIVIDLQEAGVTPGRHVLTVRADDNIADRSTPRGKQDLKFPPTEIFYVPTTGIWQTVWTEQVPATALARLDWTADLPNRRLGLRYTLEGNLTAGTQLEVTLDRSTRFVGRGQVAYDRFDLSTGDHGIKHADLHWIEVGTDLSDVEWASLMWSPEAPNILDATVSLLDAQGVVLDTAFSYTALRSVEIISNPDLADGPGVYALNGKRYDLRWALDQGYWPGSGMTANQEALQNDVVLALQCGFNGVRKHQKVEQANGLEIAARHGLMVSLELPSPRECTQRAAARSQQLWAQILDHFKSHPAITMTVVYNESAGIDDPSATWLDAHLESMAYLTKELGPSVPMILNDGWENRGGDIIGIHDYNGPELLSEYYRGDVYEVLRSGVETNRLVLDAENASAYNYPNARRAVMITECGGQAIGDSDDAPAARSTVIDKDMQYPTVEAWGYGAPASNADEWIDWQAAVTSALRNPGISGICRTQLTDIATEWLDSAGGLARGGEVNGIADFERRLKHPAIASAVVAGNTRGETEPVSQPASRQQPIAG